MSDPPRLLAWLTITDGRYRAAFVSRDTPLREPAARYFDDKTSAANWIVEEAKELNVTVEWLPEKGAMSG